MQRPIPFLRSLAAILAAIVVLRIGYEPRIVGDAVGTTPIFNWLLWGYGIPAASFWAGKHLPAPRRRRCAAAHGGSPPRSCSRCCWRSWKSAMPSTMATSIARAPASPRSRCRSASRWRWRSGWSACECAPAASFTTPARSCSRCLPAWRRCSGCWGWRTRCCWPIDVGGGVHQPAAARLCPARRAGAAVVLCGGGPASGRLRQHDRGGRADSRAGLCDVRDPADLSRPGHVRRPDHRRRAIHLFDRLAGVRRGAARRSAFSSTRSARGWRRPP